VSDSIDDNLRRQPSQDRSTQRVTLILDTTAALVDEVGLSGLTPALIARRSDMSGPAIYRYFADLDAIVRALATRNLERFLDRTADLLADSELSWEDAIAASVDNYAHMYRTEPSFRSIRLGSGAGSLMNEGVSNKRVIAQATIAHFAPRYETWDRESMPLRVEVMIEIIEALVSRAFEPDGEDNEAFFLGEAKRLGVAYLAEILETVPGTPPAEHRVG